MKYLKQFLIILAISMIGEILKYLLPLPVPASIYGMLILFVGLMTGIIRLESCFRRWTMVTETPISTRLCLYRQVWVLWHHGEY